MVDLVSERFAGSDKFKVPTYQVQGKTDHSSFFFFTSKWVLL